MRTLSFLLALTATGPALADCLDAVRLLPAVRGLVADTRAACAELGADANLTTCAEALAGAPTDAGAWRVAAQPAGEVCSGEGCRTTLRFTHPLPDGESLRLDWSRFAASAASGLPSENQITLTREPVGENLLTLLGADVAVGQVQTPATNDALCALLDRH